MAADPGVLCISGVLLSVLDQSPIAEGSTGAQALRFNPHSRQFEPD